MVGVAEQVRDERTARMVLSMIDDPDDPMTGKVLWQVGGIGTLSLLEGDGPVPALDETEAMVWRSRLAPRLNTFLLNAADNYQQRGMSTLIPTDKHWPTALGGLGTRQPYLLWTQGATSLLTGRPADRDWDAAESKLALLV
jgi:DNA processing protein